MAGGVLLAAALVSAPVPAGELDRIEAEIAALRAEQAKSAERLAALEAALASARAGGPGRDVSTTSSNPSAAADPGRQASAPAAPFNPAGGSAPGPTFERQPSRLNLGGDLRLRYEHNDGDRDARDRGRGVLRARLRALYSLDEQFAVGGQLATGDADDPNSTDITLSQFADDLDVSLDQVYLRVTSGGFTGFGGKIPLPFVRTELVWDGDVSPQGVSASYRQPLGTGSSVRASGLYFLVDEAAASADSDMIGGQISLEAALAPAFRLELAAGYYEYSLRSTAGADAGDFRSNRTAGGRYLSDFDLFDVVLALQYSGLSEAWPVRLVGNYVRNLGATVKADSGLGIDLLVGRASRSGDWRFGYGYAEAGVDAVLAAFSQDNTALATNYRQHSLSADHAPADNLILNLTYYRVRLKDLLYAAPGSAGDWLGRLRLNLLVNF